MATRHFLLVGLGVAAAGIACDEDVCGHWQLATPENDAYYESAPELRYPKSAEEECGATLGIQGNWYPTSATIGFVPSGGRTAATFGDLWIAVSFSTASAVEGATLQPPELSGEAFGGLGSSTGHRDVATLTDGWIKFHRVSEEIVDTVFNRRRLEIEWDLLWEGQVGVRYASQGRDTLDMYVMD